YLPDFKGALKGFYEENIKQTLETKTAYYENLLKGNLYFTQKTQKIVIALGIGIFLLLAIAYFWQGKYKYLALGVLTGYLLPYVYSLVQEQEEIIIFRHTYDSSDEE
ncbi:7680_t:CDS:1, partial [Gigaspora margarita]